MLALIFSRAKKRNLIGLLALGEWGPATGAISGSVTSQQGGQTDLANGAVVEPIVVVVGGGGGGGSLGGPSKTHVPAISGRCETVQASQKSQAIGDLEFVGAVLSAQTQNANAVGAVIRVVRGVCCSAQDSQHSRVSGNLAVVARVVCAQAERSVAAAAESFVGTVESRHPLGISAVEARLEFGGGATSAQTVQVDTISGEMIDTELEMITAILLQAA